MPEEDSSRAFVVASMARVTRLDRQLRTLHLGSAPLPTALPWETEGAG